MNQAQALLQQLGVPTIAQPKQEHGDKNASGTKAGPGRFHSEGHQKDSPRPSAGAPIGFVQHRAPRARRQRRADIFWRGLRQYKRQRTVTKRLIRDESRAM